MADGRKRLLVMVIASLSAACTAKFQRDAGRDDECLNRWKDPLTKDLTSFVPLHNGVRAAAPPRAFVLNPKGFDEIGFVRQYECSDVGAPYCCNAARNATSNEWEPMPK